MKIFHVTSNVQLATVSVLGLKQAKKKYVLYIIYIYIYINILGLFLCICFSCLYCMCVSPELTDEFNQLLLKNIYFLFETYNPAFLVCQTLWPIG